MSDQLSKDYVYELAKGCLSSKKVADVCSRYLKYEYLATTAQKKVFKHIFNSYNVTGITPSLGIIGQAYDSDKDVMAFLAKVRDIKIEGKEDQLLDTFESFIKNVRFQKLYYELADLYDAGKQDEVIKLLSTESQEIANFNIKAKAYIEVFEQFEDRMLQREQQALSESNILKERVTSGIHEYDVLTRGGHQKGTSFLCMAASGIGKSTYLRWNALAAARLGKRVALFQGEDTQSNALTAIDAAWTGITTDEIERGDIPEEYRNAIIKTKKEIQARGGKIYVFAQEQFDKMYIEDAREIIADIIKKDGYLDEALFDYLEIMSTKGQWSKGESSERRRREDVANKITNLATEFKIVTGTATQSMDLKPEDQNSTDFKLTRHHASEFKGVIKPFSYFFTFNCTQEEYEMERLRIWCDKFRKHKANKMITIYQSRANGRFYDAKKTLSECYNLNNAING